jgi:hypothetical protein
MFNRFFRSTEDESGDRDRELVIRRSSFASKAKIPESRFPHCRRCWPKLCSSNTRRNAGRGHRFFACIPTRKRDALNALRSLTAVRQAQERPTCGAVRSSNELPRTARERFPSYEEWLTRFDRNTADKWRHRTRRTATIDLHVVTPIFGVSRVLGGVPNSARAKRTRPGRERGSSERFCRTGSRSRESALGRGKSVPLDSAGDRAS